MNDAPDPHPNHAVQEGLQACEETRARHGLLESVLDTLCAGEHLPESARDHALTGNYKGFRECHIRPDWLLVYAVDNDRLILTASRTGSHSDLFDE